MSKRFTATEKWEKQWYRKLAPVHKCLWQYLCDKCDIAGVWEPDFELASMQIGAPVTGDDLRVFGDRLRLLENGKIYLLSFVEFQYGKLSKDCRAHIPIFALTQKHFGGSMPYRIGYPKGMDRDKEQEQEPEKEPETGVGTGGVEILRPTLDQLRAAAATTGLPDAEIEACWNHYQAQGWKRANGMAVTDLPAIVANWKRKYMETKNVQGTGKTNSNRIEIKHGDWRTSKLRLAQQPANDGK